MASNMQRTIWPEWQIEDKPLGRGSYGVVYKAVRRDYNMENYAAIKVISIPSDPSEIDSLRSEGLDYNATKAYLQGIVNDFVSEIQLMESLKGVQNIVSVEDYKVVEKTDQIGWDIYIRMELLTSFNTFLCDRKLTEADIIKLGCDICTALEICGQRNIIHRDIKPENIFINDFGHFKLGDFGIARKLENMTGGLSQKGTFNYMAPEIALGGGYDSRVDTYSLGIVLYRLLNGNRLPFLNTEAQLLNPNERRNAVDRRLRGELLPPPCEASTAMAGLILRACAYDPQLRFSSPTEMKNALLRVRNGTYLMNAANNLDKTTAVRKASGDYNKTTAVRKPPATNSNTSVQSMGTFGVTPRKKISPSSIIAILIATILVISIIYLVSLLLKRLPDWDLSWDFGKSSDDTSSEGGNYSAFDEEQIDEILAEAEELAEEGDYEGALTKVQIGLVTYPKSEALQEESERYTIALESQIKEFTLAQAAGLADAGDYVSAMAVIQQAQETYGNDADYQAAYDAYEQAYAALINTAPPETEPPLLFPDSSLDPLVKRALEFRADEDAKWDRVEEFPGDSTYSGYVYMEKPNNPSRNRLYLVFLVEGTVKKTPIQFIYWVYFNDVKMDAQGNLSYSSIGTARDDRYTAKTGYGSYYSYYGIDDYAMFDYYIISANSSYEVVESTITELPIEHHVSDTFH